ncbi:GNAT family N-acetyltransferase [Flavilitoribacter nigricans]|uniref:GNAT family N-acetyltransferase n=1 Tax=Flavilitoribacter nigricans (strain ATCC 23147 / DSM 23189 / NBRC 102662 / NCIMB 1420 / SS-2) TaxID=1122177 RepID=A0A2D0N4Y4_FLAN2|nr:N-acetyltransferase [Flavilitoribacter nigricans]PHN03219.1 GNAT family N-acetyltransferase [Flavilitoribacter nigricans DSM 23189 = NBRC 102662]
MASLQIRPATTADLEAVWHLWKTIMDQKVYFPYDDTYTREQIEESWINLSNAIFVAETETEIVGAYILKPNQPGYGKHIANAAYMVDTRARGQGIGDQLCAHSVAAARTLGYRGMQFNLVVSTNKAAIRTWQANGFSIIGTVPGGFYQEGLGYVDAHIFFMDLTR